MSIATFEPFGVVDHKKSEVKNGTNIIAKKQDLENLLDDLKNSSETLLFYVAK